MNNDTVTRSSSVCCSDNEEQKSKPSLRHSTWTGVPSLPVSSFSSRISARGRVRLWPYASLSVSVTLNHTHFSLIVKLWKIIQLLMHVLVLFFRLLVRPLKRLQKCILIACVVETPAEACSASCRTAAALLSPPPPSIPPPLHTCRACGETPPSGVN